MVEITPQQIFTTWWKNLYPHQNFLPHPSPQWDGRFLPYPFNVVWKTLACLNFSSRGRNNFHIFLSLTVNYDSVWHLSFLIEGTPGHRKLFLYPRGNIELDFKEWKYSQDYSLKRALITLLSEIVCELSLCFS